MSKAILMVVTDETVKMARRDAISAFKMAVMAEKMGDTKTAREMLDGSNECAEAVMMVQRMK